MICPKCGGNQWNAKLMDVPISQDTITCVPCGYELTSAEAMVMEQEVVAIRMKRRDA